MLKKHTTLLLLIAAILLLVIATLNYPGGSQVDKNSVGYSWANNYVSNLFGETAVNGMHNPARFWAVGGMVFLSAGLACFFVRFAKRIPQRGAANVIKYIGAGGMVFTFLIATPLHDVMITISSTLFLIGMFYITVFVLKSKLHLFKVLCIIGLLIFYVTLYMYGMHQVTYLPIMQKICFASTMALVLGLEYCTGAGDFQAGKAGK
ncbi:hypothetical protein HQ865_22345 [Mucilaginibacter mali]|uniref:DUF998 domain-containing protein n=1 Tax=Mucilaginibacter mali TaxID=2740462 RepID=A0A7D4PXD3_9SPHI|nr:hypothetical protein [Mucilaginibacter mali]QKJ32383.1 hypothetical protein HQ865_22345 [Mucilaginibacter mali]